MEDHAVVSVGVDVSAAVVDVAAAIAFGGHDVVVSVVVDDVDINVASVVVAKGADIAVIASPTFVDATF